MWRFALAPGVGTESATLGVDLAAGRRCPPLLGADEDDSIGWNWTVLENCDLRQVDGGRREDRGDRAVEISPKQRAGPMSFYALVYLSTI
jgi:hypothetical protein